MGLSIERAVLAAHEGLGESTLEYNRTSSAPLQEEVLVAVLISWSPKEVRTYLHVQVREDTARLSHVRQLLYDYFRADKAWKAPRREETAETNSPNAVPMDVEVARARKARAKASSKVTETNTMAKVKASSQ